AAPTTHRRLLGWVRETAELTQPDRVEWVDGSPEEWVRITDLLVEAGTFVRLNPDKLPNSFYAASDPGDVARVEDRTFICSRDQRDAGPTNNWLDPDDMKAILTERYRGAMRGRVHARHDPDGHARAREVRQRDRRLGRLRAGPAQHRGAARARPGRRRVA